LARRQNSVQSAAPLNKILRLSRFARTFGRGSELKPANARKWQSLIEGRNATGSS
jgi:hypothetical protein